MNDIDKFVTEKILTGKFITLDLFQAAAIVWIVVLAIFFIVITSILSYHWKHYVVTKESLSHIRKIYFGASFGFIVIIAAFAGMFLRS